MQSGTITDLCNLKFFSDTGIEIQTQQQYSITWKLESDHKRLNQVPEGYILGDIEKVEHIARTADGHDFEYYRLKPDSLVIGFTKFPEIILSAKEYQSIDTVGISTTIHNVLCSTRKARLSKVTITMETRDNSYSVQIPTNQFFESLSYTWSTRTVYTGDNDNGDKDLEHKKIIVVTGAQLAICDDRSLPADKKYCLWEELDPKTNYTTTFRSDDYYPSGFHAYLYYLLEPGERAVFRTDPKTTLSRDKHYPVIDPYDAIKPIAVRGIA